MLSLEPLDPLLLLLLPLPELLEPLELYERASASASFSLLAYARVLASIWASSSVSLLLPPLLPLLELEPEPLELPLELFAPVSACVLTAVSASE